MPSTFNHFMSLEEAATGVVSWQTALVPGLLQTREYRRALLWAEFPEMPSREVEMSLDVVMHRQELLDKSDFHFEALIAEAVLYGMVGGPAVTADQLTHLLSAAERPNVTMRIVGRRAKDPLGLLTGPFVVFDFPPLPTSRMSQPPTAFVEGHFGQGLPRAGSRGRNVFGGSGKVAAGGVFGGQVPRSSARGVEGVGIVVDLSTAQWFKSSRSSGQRDCVEVAFLAGGVVGVRDSKNPSGSALAFDSDAWDRFLAALPAGEA